MKKSEDVLKLERAVRKLKAERSNARKLVRQYEKELDLTTQIVDVVHNAVEAAPSVVVPKIKIYGESAHDEVAVLLLSDVHIGKRTLSYNPKVFVKRLGILRDAMMSIVTAQRSIRPIRKLVILWGGDIVDAEAVYPSQAVDHISIPIIDQLFAVGVPELTGFLLFCLEQFEEVECYCVRGNHGRQNAAKWSSSKSTNWDFVLYRALEAATREQERLKWNINTKDWKTMFRIMGKGFLLTHGDMIRRYYNLPWYGMTRQAMRWQNAYQTKMKLRYFCFGHFHSASFLRFNNCVIIVNGSFVSDDSFAEEYIGVASVPEQQLFGMHPKHGISWRYTLSLK